MERGLGSTTAWGRGGGVVRRGNSAVGLVLVGLMTACGGPPEPNVPSDEETALDSSLSTGSKPSSPASQNHATVAADPDLVRRLGDDATRERAVTELIQHYNDVAKNGTKTPVALAFANAYAEPAANAYVAGYSTLAVPTRHQLLQTLLAFDSDVAAPAFVHAIQSYARSGSGADDAIWACQAASRRKLTAFEAPLLEAYTAVDTSDKDGLRYSRHLARAMTVQRKDAWNSEFERQLSTPLVPPPRYDDKPAVRQYQSALFRQIIATRLLGESKSDKAAVSLINVLLDSNKAEIHPAAEVGLAKVGKAALPHLLSLLDERGPFVEPAKNARPDLKTSAVYFATKWLDLIRSNEAEPALLNAWSNTRDPVARTLIVRSLSRLPHSKAGIDALKTTYAQTDIKVTLPEGESALEVLAEAAVQFYEPSLALWLRERTDHVPTVWTRRADVLTTLVVQMSRLLREQDVAKVETTAQRYGGKTGTAAFLTAKEQVQSCHEDAKCYLDALTKGETPFASLKAATMLGVVGSAASRDALIDIALSLDAPEVLNQVLASIEELTTSSDAPQAYARLKEAANQELESTTPTWSRAKRSAIALTLTRLER